MQAWFTPLSGAFIGVKGCQQIYTPIPDQIQHPVGSVGNSEMTTIKNLRSQQIKFEKQNI